MFRKNMMRAIFLVAVIGLVSGGYAGATTAATGCCDGKVSEEKLPSTIVTAFPGKSGILSPSNELESILDYATNQQSNMWGVPEGRFLFEEFVLFARDIARLHGCEITTIEGLASAGWLPFEPKGEIEDFQYRQCMFESNRFADLDPGCEIALQKRLILAFYSSVLPRRIQFNNPEEIEMVYGKMIPSFFVNPITNQAMEMVFGKTDNPVDPPYISVGSLNDGVGPVTIKTRCFGRLKLAK